MNCRSLFPMTLIAAAVLAGCATVPPNNMALENARSDYRAAQADPQTRSLAGAELRQAGDALDRANSAWRDREDIATVDHLAYLAKQRTAIAEQTASLKAAELAVTNANAARDRVRLAARTREADLAVANAQASQRDAQASQRDADASLRASQLSAAQADEARRRSEAAQLQSEASQQQALDADRRAALLQQQLTALDAKQTNRGLVITMGDVLFDTDRAQLKSSGERGVEKLAGFLKEYPQRRALIEGFTDSTGTEGHNQELSGRRANAVRNALVDMGVGGDRIATRGYGESYPVASNDGADGRQLNRRVEIVLSDDSGNIAPR
jgi:outer membrane protein OmpA-like peptidoglycan-associated protein